MTTAAPSPTLTVAAPTAADELRLAAEQKAAAIIAQRDNEKDITDNMALIPAMLADFVAARDIIGNKTTDLPRKRQELAELLQRIDAKTADAVAAKKVLAEANAASKKIQKEVTAAAKRKAKIAATHAKKQTAVESTTAAYSQTEGLLKAANEAAAPDADEIKRLKTQLKEQRRARGKAQRELKRAQARLDLATQHETDKKAVEARKLAGRDAAADLNKLVRKELASLARKARKDLKDFKQAEAELIALQDQQNNRKEMLEAKSKAVEDAEAKRVALLQDIDTAQAAITRYTEQLRQETEAAQRAAEEAQQQAAEADQRATEAAQRAASTANASSEDATISVLDNKDNVIANMGKADNFTQKQLADLVAIFKTQLDRPGTAWKDHFHYEVSNEADCITFDNRTAKDAPETATKKITVNPRLMHIHGAMDDKAIQAALLAANMLWEKEGIQIKTMNPWLKSRILANAEHLHRMGKIKKYKTRTWLGVVGEGFNAAQEITAPRATWRLGLVSYYKHRLDCIENGLESDTGYFAKRKIIGKKTRTLNAAAPA